MVIFCSGERRIQGRASPSIRFWGIGAPRMHRCPDLRLRDCLSLLLRSRGIYEIELREEGRAAKILSAPTDGSGDLAWRNSQFGLDVMESFFTRARPHQDRVSGLGRHSLQRRRRGWDDLIRRGSTPKGFRPFTRIVYRIERSVTRSCKCKTGASPSKGSGFRGRF
jgi:hypothetical protein